MYPNQPPKTTPPLLAPSAHLVTGRKRLQGFERYIPATICHMFLISLLLYIWLSWSHLFLFTGQWSAAPGKTKLKGEMPL